MKKLILLIVVVFGFNLPAFANEIDDLKQKCEANDGRSCNNLGAMYDKQGDFYKTDFGFNIHQDCFDNLGKNKIEGAIKQVLTTGLQCLANLEDKFQEENPGSESIGGALRNAVDIRRFLEQDNLKLVCDEKGYRTGVGGRASASDYQKIEDYNGKGYDVWHPFMSLFPVVRKYSTRSVAKVIFHEIFHSVGQFHGTGIEYAYSCQECCFPHSKRSKKAIDLSCKICGLDKSKANTRPYLLDFIKWTHLNEKNRGYVTDAVMNYIKEYPEDRRWGIVQIIDAQSGPFSPTAIELANILEKRLPVLTYDEKRIFAEVRKNKKYSGVKGYDVQSKAVAESLYSFLYEQNRTKALSSLENQLESLKKPHSSEKGTTIETRKLLELVLNEIRFSQNSSYAETRRANNLFKRLNL